MTLQAINTAEDRAPVVLLHASGSSHKQWFPLVDLLCERHDVVALDLPGYGKEAPQRLGEVDGMAATAIPMIAEILKLDEPVHLVGHSFGGGVALKIALMRPDLVKSLTLYEPAAFSMLRDGPAADRRLLEDFRTVGRTLAIASRVGQPMAGVKGFVDFWNGVGTWEQMPPHIQEKMCRTARAVAGDFENVHSEQWSVASLKQLSVPTCIMMGLESPEIAQRTAGNLASAIPGADLAILPCLGHMAPLTDPEWVNPRICDHIARAERTKTPCAWPQRTAA